MNKTNVHAKYKSLANYVYKQYLLFMLAKLVQVTEGNFIGVCENFSHRSQEQVCLHSIRNVYRFE